jgi:hypothetical protein
MKVLVRYTFLAAYVTWPPALKAMVFLASAALSRLGVKRNTSLLQLNAWVTALASCP